jgi:hypothetical protein
MTTTFFFAQYVNLTFELSVWSDEPGLQITIPRRISFFSIPRNKNTSVITSFTVDQAIFGTFQHRYKLKLIVASIKPMISTAITHVDHTTLDTTSSNSTTTSDREYVFNGHQEWLDQPDEEATGM